MSSSLDLNILPLARHEGQDLSEIPGLYAVTPPRRTSRGRSSDNLIIYLTLSGNAPMPVEGYQQIFPRLTRAYYKTSGSATAAMRALAEELNHTLLDRNLRSTSAGKQSIGLLILAVLREKTVYLAHCGPVHSFLVATDNTRHMYDADTSNRGLGLSRNTNIRYFQSPLNPGDYLVFTAQPPGGWTQETLKPARQGLSGMRRSLLDHAPADLNAIVIQAQTGTGKLRLLRLKTGVEDMAHAPEAEEEVQSEVSEPPIPTGTPPKISETLPEEEQEGEPQRGEMHKTLPAAQHERPEEAKELHAPIIHESLAKPSHKQSMVTSSPSETRHDMATAQTASTSPSSDEKIEHPQAAPTVRSKLPKLSIAPLIPILSAFGRAVSNTSSIIGRGLGGLLKNILPDESVLHLPSSMIVLLAVAIPLIISIIGGTVYIQRGRTAQHQVYFQQAQDVAEQARTQTDAEKIRTDWNRTLDYLDQAEFYGETDKSNALRNEAIAILDQLDGIVRLDFLPAIIGGLGDNMHITQMVATTSDLYMLDSQQGIVKRAFMTNQGYEIDARFICGPSQGQTIIGDLVDIISLPRGTVGNATLLAMDANANLMYCTPDGEQPITKQIAPPSTNFGEPIALTLDMGDLYLLDPSVNAVWIYRNQDTAQQPRFFFGDEIPPMQDVIDLAVNNDDLYLLHADGHITTCIYSGFQGSPTRCEEPATYIDPRPGRENGAVIPDALFNQIYFSPPPDPSMYMLDPDGQAIYHFSLRLAFQRQFQAIKPLVEGPATAFAVSPNRTVLMAIGNEVYYAALP